MEGRATKPSGSYRGSCSSGCHSVATGLASDFHDAIDGDNCRRDELFTVGGYDPWPTGAAGMGFSRFLVWWHTSGHVGGETAAMQATTAQPTTRIVHRRRWSSTSRAGTCRKRWHHALGAHVAGISASPMQASNRIHAARSAAI